MSVYEFDYRGRTLIAEYDGGAMLCGRLQDKYIIWWDNGENAYERVTSVWIERKIKVGSDKFIDSLKREMRQQDEFIDSAKRERHWQDKYYAG